MAANTDGRTWLYTTDWLVDGPQTASAVHRREVGAPLSSVVAMLTCAACSSTATVERSSTLASATVTGGRTRTTTRRRWSAARGERPTRLLSG